MPGMSSHSKGKCFWPTCCFSSWFCGTQAPSKLCLCSSQYDKVQDGLFPSTHFSLADSLHGAFANSIHELTLNSFSLKTYRMIFHKHVKILFTIRKHMCAVLTPQKNTFCYMYIHCKKSFRNSAQIKKIVVHSSTLKSTTKANALN